MYTVVNTSNSINYIPAHGEVYMVGLMLSSFSVAYCSRSVVFSGIMISFVNVTEYYDITEISLRRV